MLLYHVSADTDVLERKFVPKVPELSSKASEIEDTQTPRICFAETVSGCFSALPKYSRLKLTVKGARFVLYILDTDKFSPEDFVTNAELIRNKMVYDANITKEWWLLKPVTLKGTLCEVLSAVQQELPEPPLLPDTPAWNYQISYK